MAVARIDSAGPHAVVRLEALGVGMVIADASPSGGVHAALLGYYISNATLGFQKVFAIGFPQRTDKLPIRQPGIEMYIFQASWDLISDDRIVADRISTALILEDDSDWDVTLKSQLVEFARGARLLQNSGSHDHPSSPYGDNWDMLRSHVRPAGRKSEFGEPDMTPWKERANTTRLVYEANDAVCLNGYAVTYNGARRALAAMSMAPLNQPVDLGFSDLCRRNAFLNFTCIAPHPRLISFSLPADPNVNKASDIHKDDSEWHEVSSNGIVYSAIMNVQPRLAGAKTAKAQYEECPRQFISLNMTDVGRGRLEVIDLPEESGEESSKESEQYG
ncbi:hypothetical protein VTN77DRAFT_5758 [Rasamsonia byssochlamydoides]|uniref:uncharacterized protein n=1 Tax=Rasamsonia byssochlamydoides TaxID=89139 RepID=UPI003743E2D8